MDVVSNQTYLGVILHDASQALLLPDVVLLLVFMGYALFCIGSVVVEGIIERRHFHVTMPQFLAALNDAAPNEIEQVVRTSGLLNRQKDALLTVYEYRALPGDSLLALIRRTVSEEEARRDKVVGRNDIASKVAPMLGLMGTLIPLGPGIAALGTGDVTSLSQSIIVAFDTTVAGLATAVVCLIVAKVRRGWYENYMTALDSAMATMLQKIGDMREADFGPDVKQPGETTMDTNRSAASIVFANGAVGASKVPDAEPLAQEMAHDSVKAQA
ncbi:hypothetical protein AAY81_07810 [Denitrobacterium detoxificans]|uniref:Biopolymer transport protein ExbB/TolQ n=1 Tax=Denitrobacterium detoxificans TaxID=79604 RepID=A0A172RZ63_9ACTN|nr:MotA/TolQ/ExbB proton channel family protein [Denitrobacterium detoxificans]ANE23031.1 hypothetical protein AAY81_07810 [Denitrobacterium detoxificans]SEO50725.1 Biopolymer transport protein ExbB/TolQ [Denitrobacterium detoxificans]